MYIAATTVCCNLLLKRERKATPLGPFKTRGQCKNSIGVQCQLTL